MSEMRKEGKGAWKPALFFRTSIDAARILSHLPGRIQAASIEEDKTEQIARLKLLRQKIQDSSADMAEYIEATTDENILEKLCGKYDISWSFYGKKMQFD